MASGNKVLTAINEWKHGKLHWTPEGEKLDLRIKECHAAAVQYAVATHFGVPAEYSADYILEWGNDSAVLKAELDMVGATEVHMMKAIHALEGEGHDHYDLAKVEPQRQDETQPEADS